MSPSRSIASPKILMTSTFSKKYKELINVSKGGGYFSPQIGRSPM